LENDASSRTLKGVMKYYKDQPRITDSLELDQVEPIGTDTSDIKSW
jgi:hypothetical protein